MKSPVMYKIQFNLFKVCSVNAWRCQIYRDGWINPVLLIALVAKL